MFIVALFTTTKRWKQQMSVDGWMDQQNVVYTYDGIFLNHKRRWSSDTFYSTNEPWKHWYIVEERKHKRSHYMIPFIWYIQHRRGAEERGNRKWLFGGSGVFFWGDENAHFGTRGTVLYNTVNIWMPPNMQFKVVNFMLSEFHHNIKKASANRKHLQKKKIHCIQQTALCQVLGSWGGWDLLSVKLVAWAFWPLTC